MLSQRRRIIDDKPGLVDPLVLRAVPTNEVDFQHLREGGRVRGEEGREGGKGGRGGERTWRDNQARGDVQGVRSRRGTL